MMPMATLVRGIRRRHLLPEVKDALTDTRVVLIVGARQAGKSTLAQLVVGQSAETMSRTLDDEATLAAARDDPTEFVRVQGTLFIDEVQRAPELLPAIKKVVDRSNRPGQFLLTGSANVLTMPQVVDALPGRMQVVELWPFSQGEIEGQVDGFVDRAFAGWGGRTTTTLVKLDYLQRAVRGGFPEVVIRVRDRRRGAWFESYVGAVVQRDIRDLSGIERTHELRQLLRLIAARSGQLLNVDELARDARLPPTTARRYLRLLESAYVIKTVPGWATSKTTRAVHAPKVYVCDPGLLAHLLGVDAASLAAPTSEAGPVLETFVAMELCRQLGWAETRGQLFHFRTKDGTEVDSVVEAADGRIVGVEVKAGATVRSEDFRGLRLLANKVGHRFRGGLLLYTGADTLSFGDRLWCAPLSALWGTGRGQ
jgi:predicted AAA+ superfamily ATPase